MAWGPLRPPPELLFCPHTPSGEHRLLLWVWGNHQPIPPSPVLMCHPAPPPRGLEACPPAHLSAPTVQGRPLVSPTCMDSPLMPPLPGGCHYCLHRRTGDSERAGHLLRVTQQVSRWLGLEPQLERPSGPRAMNLLASSRQQPATSDRGPTPSCDLYSVMVPGHPSLSPHISQCWEFGQDPGTKGPQFTPGATPGERPAATPLASQPSKNRPHPNTRLRLRPQPHRRRRPSNGHNRQIY